MTIFDVESYVTLSFMLGMVIGSLLSFLVYLIYLLVKDLKGKKMKNKEKYTFIIDELTKDRNRLLERVHELEAYNKPQAYKLGDLSHYMPVYDKEYHEWIFITRIKHNGVWGYVFNKVTHGMDFTFQYYKNDRFYPCEVPSDDN